MTTELTFPDKGLVESFEIYRRRKPSVTLVVKRDVVNPVLFRNTNPDRAETQEFQGQLHAQANGEKFVSKERLTGLDLLRSLDEDGDLIDPDYAYNEPEGIESSLNLDTITYGLAGTGDQEFGLKSHVIEGYTFTTDEYDLMNREVRNAVHESGTMQDEEGEQSQALYEHVTIEPGNSFVQFVTLEAATPAMLAYVLHNIKTTGMYGARETRAGKTLDNQILGLILGEHDTALSTGELLMDYHDPDQSIEDSISSYLADREKSTWDIFSDDLEVGEATPDWFVELEAVAAREREGAKETLRDLFLTQTEEARSVLL